jgi:formylglycine-generating enzyme required for sulfatase activity
MGSPASEERHEDGEVAHEVEITRPFYLGVFTVTQEQYQAVMKSNPSHFHSKGRGAAKVAGLDTSAFPVEQASWQDAADFCRRLTKKERKSRPGMTYRLPSEAEWEYACRAGTTTPFHFGEQITPALANYDVGKGYGGGPTGKSRKRPVPVGTHVPNAFGLYEMHGNVWNLCLDDRREYDAKAVADPLGPTVGDGVLIRGGGWDSWPWGCRSAYRCGYGRASHNMHVGFRVALAAET